MTGEEIYDFIQAMHKTYVNSKKDNEVQPETSLTKHQCFKLSDFLYSIPFSCHVNSLRALAEGELKSFNYRSVKITLKGGEKA